MSDDLLEKLLLDGRLLHEIHYKREELEPAEFKRREPGEIMQSLPADFKVYVELGWLLQNTLPLQNRSISQIVMPDLDLAKTYIKERLSELMSIAKKECMEQSEIYRQLKIALEEAERLLYKDGILPEETTKRKVKI